MGIFLPQRWRRQPAYPCEIDRGHPLAQEIALFPAAWQLQSTGGGAGNTYLWRSLVPGASWVGNSSSAITVNAQGLAKQSDGIETSSFSIGANLGTRYTLAVLVRTSGNVASTQNFISKDDGSAVRHHQFRIDSGQFEFYRFDTGLSAYGALGGVITANSYYALMAVSDGTAMRTYRNGSPAATATISGTPSTADGTLFFISRASGIDVFLGQISYCAAWRRPFTPAEALDWASAPYQLIKPLVRRTYFLSDIAAAVQYAYPISDIAAGGWLPSTGSDIHPLLADGSTGTPDDATYGFTLLPGQTYKFRLTSVNDPLVSTGHKYRYRAYSPQSRTLQIDIYAGVTFIATRQQVLTPGVTEYEVTLTGPETDLIPAADYDELYGWATGLAS